MNAPIVQVHRHLAFEDLGNWEEPLISGGCSIDMRDIGVSSPAWCSTGDSNSYLDPDILIVLGGPIGVNDRILYPFIDSEIAGIKARLEAQKPTIGICLGAQLMAVAAGGDVQPGGQGYGGQAGSMEIGFSPLTLAPTAQGTVLEELRNVEVLHWHGDCFSIPDHAYGGSLASTVGYPNQAFILGTRDNPYGLALQCHPEFNYRRAEQWLIGHTGDLRAQGVDILHLREDMAQKGPALEKASQAMIKAWLRACGF